MIPYSTVSASNVTDVRYDHDKYPTRWRPLVVEWLKERFALELSCALVPNHAWHDGELRSRNFHP